MGGLGSPSFSSSFFPCFWCILSPMLHQAHYHEIPIIYKALWQISGISKVYVNFFFFCFSFLKKLKVFIYLDYNGRICLFCSIEGWGIIASYLCQQVGSEQDSLTAHDKESLPSKSHISYLMNLSLMAHQRMENTFSTCWEIIAWKGFWIFFSCEVRTRHNLYFQGRKLA